MTIELQNISSEASATHLPEQSVKGFTTKLFPFKTSYVYIRVNKLSGWFMKLYMPEINQTLKL